MRCYCCREEFKERPAVPMSYKGPIVTVQAGYPSSYYQLHEKCFEELFFPVDEINEIQSDHCGDCGERYSMSGFIASTRKGHYQLCENCFEEYCGLKPEKIGFYLSMEHQ